MPLPKDIQLLSPSARMFTMVRLLATGPRSPMELAKALNVQRRAVEKIVRRLRAQGIPIVKQKTGRTVVYLLDERR